MSYKDDVANWDLDTGVMSLCQPQPTWNRDTDTDTVVTWSIMIHTQAATVTRIRT